MKYCTNEKGHDPMEPLTHCDQTLQVHRIVQNEFPRDFPADDVTIVFFYLYAAACLQSTLLPSYGGYLEPQDPSGGILLAEQGGAPPRFHTQNVLASVMCSDE